MAFQIYLNILWLPLIALVSAFIGFLLRSGQLKKVRQRVLSLENEMLKNHAEILELQKEIVKFQNIQNNSKTPVVSIKDSPAEEKTSAK